MNSDIVTFYCLEAICAIDPRPAEVPSAVRDCLDEPDYDLRAKALGYVSRAKRVDELSVVAVKRVAKDPKGPISNRSVRALGLGDSAASGRRTAPAQ